jgi:two-component system response regulator CssR
MRQEGWNVHTFETADEVFSSKYESPHLWIFDMDQPSISDYDLIKNIRQNHGDVPIILTSTATSLADRVLGLELGADDFIDKPFEARELIIRSHRLLYRTNQYYLNQRNNQLLLQTYIVDEGKRVVKFENEEIFLTSKEFDLISMFAKNSGYALSREQILDKIWGSCSYSNYRVVDDLVRRVRGKLTDLRIETIYGHGYRAVV